MILAMIAFASCGGDDDGETTTEAAQPEGASSDGAVSQVVKAFRDPGSAVSQFEAFDWEANLVRRVPERTSAPQGQAILEVVDSPGVCPSRSRFQIRDRPALTGEDLDKAEQGLDPTTNEPIVILTLTSQGQRRFEQLTRAVAQRGAKEQRAGGAPSDGGQHFALVVGDRVVSLPIIDPAENPKGIDASSGVQITGGMTLGEAQELARALNPG
jgi:SecD/SecF fusion protein